MQKVSLLFEFYKSTLPIYIGLYVVSVFTDLYSLYVNLCIISIPMVYFQKYFYKNEYIFYYNQGLNKRMLYGFCLGINILIATISIVFYEAFS